MLWREKLGVRAGELFGEYGGGGVLCTCVPDVTSAVGIMGRLSRTVSRPDTLTAEV